MNYKHLIGLLDFVLYMGAVLCIIVFVPTTPWWHQLAIIAFVVSGNVVSQIRGQLNA